MMKVLSPDNWISLSYEDYVSCTNKQFHHSSSSGKLLLGFPQSLYHSLKLNAPSHYTNNWSKVKQIYKESNKS